MLHLRPLTNTILRTTLSFVWFSFWATTALAQSSELCEKTLGTGTSAAFITCETDAQGRVIFTIGAPNSGDESATTYRAAGLAPAGFKYDGQDMAEYFNRTPANVANQKQIIYTPKPDAVVEAGKQITFNKYGEQAYVEWMTPQNANAYTQSFNFTYTYGTSCEQLPAPVLTSVNANNIPVFTPVAGATSYVVTVKLNNVVKYTQTMSGAQAITYTPLESGTYKVSMVARGANKLTSEPSNEVDWILTAAPVEIGPSEYCYSQITSTSNGTLAYLSWETLDNGDVEITITGEGGTAFRANGMANNTLSGFRVGTVDASLYFSRQLTAGSNTFRLHLKSSSIRPARGETISYAGNIEWTCASNNNAYVNKSMSYTYGAICIQLATPVLTSVTNDIPRFSPVQYATRYVARVYLNGELKHMETIQHGAAIHFTPSETATYQVTLAAEADRYVSSEESEPVDWQLTAPEIQVGPSEYCTSNMGSGTSRVGITWETLSNGDVEISINEDGAAFRANGLGSIGNFTVGTLPASTYFTVQYEGNGSNTYVLHLRNASMVPTRGTKIRYSGTVEWRTASNSNAYGTQSFTYTYGSQCPHLDTPAIRNISEDGMLIMDGEVEGATGYIIRIYRGELLIYTMTAGIGDVLEFNPVITYNYTVTAQAVGGRGTVPSAESEPYFWHCVVPEQEQPMSTLCQKIISSNDGGVRLTATTDSVGTIIFKITGPSHPVWRAGGMQTDIMTVCGYPITNYFTKSASFVGDSVMTLVPKAGAHGVIVTGDMIKYSGNCEWSVLDASGAPISRWVTDLAFEYMYGTDCNPVLTRLFMPANLAITPVGELTFSAVENAGSYQVKVEDDERDVMSVLPIMSGDTVQREMSILADFHYHVAVRAIPADNNVYRPSLWSNEVLWVPSYLARQDDGTVETPDTSEDSWEENPDNPVYPPVVFPDDVALEDIVTEIPLGKFIYHGQVYISRNGHIFTVLGQLVK